MRLGRLAIIICFALLLGVPLVFRPRSEEIGGEAAGPAQTLIIITPHNEQIRYEFARAFDRWHQRHYGERVKVAYNVPGGTTEIRRMLESQYTAALERGLEPGGDADLVFGGGSFEHNRLKRGVRITRDGVARDEPISQPVRFDDAWLQQMYGENRIGEDPVYDKDKYWFGLALSGFGIVYNRDVLDSLRLPEPSAWRDLCDPALRGWVALVNPGQSGSVTTAFQSILTHTGWIDGWRILRRMAANARYFSASSLKPPMDVAQGDAAMGVCIDFYGRFQSQALAEAGDPHRLGYVDPPGGVTIDADPISMLRGAPHPQLAKRFIEFCLSEEGQALWQFPARPADDLATAPAASSEPRLGPERFELRRLPVRRIMYEQHAGRMIDKVNPYEIATPAAYPDSNFRDFIMPMYSAMAIDTHEQLRQAWTAIVEHPAYPRGADSGGEDGLVTADDISDPELKRMLERFDAMPTIEGPGGATYDLGDVKSLGEVRSGWLRGGWAQSGLWHPQSTPLDAMRRRLAAFFRAQYQEVAQGAQVASRP